MNTPDLIQRIYFEKEKGNDLSFKKIFTDLRARSFEFILHFDFEGRRIFWTCFESGKYKDIIQEPDEYVYFYLWDEKCEFEVIIPGHTYLEELNIPILNRTPSFHSGIWIIGPNFPGLEGITQRPIKIYLKNIRRDMVKTWQLNYWLKKMLATYASLRKPIFEVIDYPNESRGEKRWKKIADKKI